MAHQLEIVQHVNAPPESVWMVIADIPGSPATIAGIESVEVLTPGEYAVGYRWRETRKMMGKTATEEMWVNTVDAPRSTSVKAESGGANYTTVFTLTPQGGGTELRMVFGAVLVDPGFFSRIMMAVFGRIGLNLSRKAMQQDLRDIARAAEARAE